MRNPNASAINALDAAAQLVPRVAAPWMGVLWLTALPLRLLQVYFIAQLVRLDAPWKYFHYFLNLAAWLCAAFVFSLFGRAVFVRACRFPHHKVGSDKLGIGSRGRGSEPTAGPIWGIDQEEYFARCEPWPLSTPLLQWSREDGVSVML